MCQRAMVTPLTMTVTRSMVRGLRVLHRAAAGRVYHSSTGLLQDQTSGGGSGGAGNEDSSTDCPATRTAPRPGQHKVLDVLYRELSGQAKVQPDVPAETDIAVIGGGLMGMAMAYWLKEKHSAGFTVTVIEKDPSYSQAASLLDLGGIKHQQLSLAQHVMMAQCAAEFLQDIKEHLTVVDNQAPDVEFNPQSSLFLATEQMKESLERSYETRTALGIPGELLDRQGLRNRFPWLNVSDVTLGSYGLGKEGWFNPLSLLIALKCKVAHLDTTLVHGEVVGLEAEHIRHDASINSFVRTEVLKEVLVRTPDNIIHPIRAAIFINCAGAAAGHIASMAGIGRGRGGLAIPLPIEPRQRYVYLVHCPEGPGLDMPLLTAGNMYVRREGLGNEYIVGISHTEGTDTVDLETYFRQHVRPLLAHRVPAFQHAEIRNAWVGNYDYNYVDQQLVVGNHPYHRNMYIASGCGGDTCLYAPAIARGITELIVHDEYQSIDLSHFTFDRFLGDDGVEEGVAEGTDTASSQVPDGRH